MATRIDLDGGKYTVINDNGKLSALRHGQPWQDLSGNNLVYWMMVEIEQLRARLNSEAITKLLTHYDYGQLAEDMLNDKPMPDWLRTDIRSVLDELQGYRDGKPLTT